MLDHKVQRKLNRFKKDLFALESVLVAFSGGVDSSLLLIAAYELLADRVQAAIVTSEFMPKADFTEAVSLVKKIGCKYHILQFDVFKSRQLRTNPENRCYLCKKRMMEKLLRLSKQKKLVNVIDGSNYDDLKSYRPGRQALAELGILSPLAQARLKKDEIRAMLREYGFENWNKPDSSCLATRFPYGTKLDEKSLKAVDCAENMIRALGFAQVRVRGYNGIACIELEKKDTARALSFLNNGLVGKLKKLGFKRICIDAEGYKSGRMDLLNV